jgi:hypothetical protein
MNILVKILSKIIILINGLIDSLSKKTIETIKYSFYGLVLVIIALGIYIGYSSGKGSAKKYGKPLTEETNAIFDPLFKKSRDKGQYRSMLESELIEEQKDIQLKKVEFPSNENLKTEIETNVIEPDKDIKKDSALKMDNQKIADVKKTDEKIEKPDVREINKDLPKIKNKDKTVRETSPMDNSKLLEK